MDASAKIFIGLAATVASSWVFHEPLGYGRRLVDEMDRKVQYVVRKQDVPGVAAAFERSPLSRDLVLSGPADDFQRLGFIDLIRNSVEGVRDISWTAASPANPPAPAREDSPR